MQIPLFRCEQIFEYFPIKCLRRAERDVKNYLGRANWGQSWVCTSSYHVSKPCHQPHGVDRKWKINAMGEIMHTLKSVDKSLNSQNEAFLAVFPSTKIGYGVCVIITSCVGQNDVTDLLQNNVSKTLVSCSLDQAQDRKQYTFWNGKL